MNRATRLFLVASFTLSSLPFLGLMVHVVFIVVTFVRIAGDVDPNGMAPSVASVAEFSLMTTMIGMMIGMVGYIALTVFNIGAAHITPNVRVGMWVLSVLWLIVVPVGTVLAVVNMVRLISRQRALAGV